METKQEARSLWFWVNIMSAIRPDKEIRGLHNGKEKKNKQKLKLFVEDMIVRTENPKESLKTRVNKQINLAILQIKSKYKVPFVFLYRLSKGRIICKT